MVIITTHVRSTREGNIFTCVCPHGGRGTYLGWGGTYLRGGRGTYLGQGGTYLGRVEGYLPWMGEGYLPWIGEGGPTLGEGRGT